MILATVAELLLLQVLLGNCADVEQAVHMCGKESDDTLEAGCECHDDKNLIICDDVTSVFACFFFLLIFR